jgi:hypothetical protein
MKHKIAKMKHPGNTKSAMRNVAKIVVTALKFGGKINGMAKWKAPKPKINNASAFFALTVFMLYTSLTFFSTDTLQII